VDVTETLRVTVSNIHRTGKRERSAAIDQAVKGPDPGSILVGSLKCRQGSLSGCRIFYLQKLSGAIGSGWSLEGEIAIGMRAQLVSIAAEGQHGAHAGQAPGTTTPFHAVDDELVDIAFNGS
jgi:hypothetical protein